MKNNTGLYAGIAAVAVVVIGGIIIMSSGGDKKTDTAMSSGDSMSKTDTTASSSSTANAVEGDAVTISNYMFGPQAIKVKAGTKVTWMNSDSVKHNIAPDKPSTDFKAGELFGKGESYSVTFAKAGTYAYHCDPHPYMHGTVVVTE